MAARSQAARSCSSSSTGRPRLVGAGRAAGVVDHQQREQPERLALGGQQRDDEARELQRAGGEVGAHQLAARRRGVARRVQQVDDREDGVETRRQLLRLRHGVRDVRGGDLLLGPRQAGRHRRLGDEEGPRDVRRRDAADQPQRQGDLRLGRERRMAAGEDQPQPVVGDGGIVHGHGRLRRLGLDQQRQLGSVATRRRARAFSAMRRATVVSHAPGFAGTPSCGHARRAAR